MTNCWSSKGCPPSFVSFNVLKPLFTENVLCLCIFSRTWRSFTADTCTGTNMDDKSNWVCRWFPVIMSPLVILCMSHHVTAGLCHGNVIYDANIFHDGYQTRTQGQLLQTTRSQLDVSQPVEMSSNQDDTGVCVPPARGCG